MRYVSTLKCSETVLPSKGEGKITPKHRTGEDAAPSQANATLKSVTIDVTKRSCYNLLSRTEAKQVKTTNLVKEQSPLCLRYSKF